MASVTQRISAVKQPRGGYLSPKEFAITQLEDGVVLNDEENIHSNLVGLAVDYLARLLNSARPADAFQISLRGADAIGELLKARQLLSTVGGLDPVSVNNACKLVGYDVCFRAGIMGYRPVDEINPDKDTIENIITMVNRSLRFFDDYGPIAKDGFTLEGGYTTIVNIGDGDFLTKDTLWDFKVSKKPPTNKHTLQLLMYYIMGKHSIYPEFNKITALGVFNPRLNTVYLCSISGIDSSIIEAIEKEVICY